MHLGVSAVGASAVATEYALPGIFLQAELLRKAGPQHPPPPKGDRAIPLGAGKQKWEPRFLPPCCSLSTVYAFAPWTPGCRPEGSPLPRRVRCALPAELG